MRIDLNGRAEELDEHTDLIALVEARAGSLRGTAVVVDQVIVPRSEWAGFRLRDGQAVELITAVQGG
jgi:sulfur carrier protein